MTAAARLISVLVPCRNEAAHVEAFCASLLAQVLPPGTAMEMLVADGASDDGTRERLAAIASGDARLRLVDNPRRIVSAGLNAALREARGEVLVRMDVHTTYAEDYLARCLEALAESGADNVGGPWRAALPAPGAPPAAHAIAAVFQSRWLAGGARSRQLDYSGPVDTVYLGAWPRATFERFGVFDETLVRNQDDEHNLRIVQGGGRIWQSAAIRSAYRPRGDVGALFRQYLQYGYWKPFVMKKHGQPAALRHLLPGLFVLALGLASMAALLGCGMGPLALLVGAYAAAVAAIVADMARNGALPRRGLPWLAPAIAAYHFGYGLGFVAGAWDATFGHVGGRPWAGRLTR